MNTSIGPGRICLGTGILLLAVAQATPAWAQAGKGKSLPGAKEQHAFATPVYRIPALLDMKDGPVLLVWADAYDPAPKPKFPMDVMPAPTFDLILWDLAANQQLGKVAYPKDKAPLSPIAAGMTAPAMVWPFGTIALSPDGKELAYVSTTHKMIPGKIVHEAQTRIQLLNIETRKLQFATPTVYKESTGLHVLFAPDGALLILRGKSCAIQDIGKAKPRKEFALVRSPFLPADPTAYSPIYAVYDAVVSPDGKKLAVAADGMIHVYDLGSGKVLFKAEPLTADPKGTTFARSITRVSLAWTAESDRLTSVEMALGPPESFVTARVFDLAAKKEVSRQKLAKEATKGGAFGAVLPQWGRAYGYFNSKGAPRAIFEGKLLDTSNGKTLHTFDPGYGVIVSRDGRFMARLTSNSGQKTLRIATWTLDNRL